MTDRVTNLANNFKTTLSADMGSTDLTATVVTTTGVPSSPCFLVIDANNAAKREVVYFDGSFTGTTLVTTLLANRYLQGSAAASGISHTAGAEVTQTALAQHVIDLNDRVTADETVNAGHRTGTPDAHHAQVHNLTHRTGGTDPLSGNLDANARVAFRANSSATTYNRRRLNLIDGAGVDVTYSEDAVNEEVDITLTSVPAEISHNALSNLAAGDVHTHYLTGGRHVSKHLYLYAQGSSQLVLATGAIDVPSCSVTFSTTAASANYRVTMDLDFDVQSSGAGFVFGVIDVDGTPTGPEITLGASAVGVWPCSRSVAGGLAPGPHTIKARAYKQVSGGAVVVNGPRCSLTIDVRD